MPYDEIVGREPGDGVAPERIADRENSVALSFLRIMSRNALVLRYPAVLAANRRIGAAMDAMMKRALCGRAQRSPSFFEP